MKKIKKILIIGAIAFMLCPSVHAAELTNTVTKSVIIQTPYRTVNKDSPDLYVGTSQLLKAGILGESKVTTFAKTHLWQTISSTEFTEVIMAPIDEILMVGSKPYPTMLSNDGTLILPCNGIVTSTDKEGSHSGFKAIDIANSMGSPIYAPADSIVTMAEEFGGYGNCIQLSSGEYSFLLGHLSSFDVVEGQVVTKGQIIGSMGSTGNSTGSHCHLELAINGVKTYIPNVFNLKLGDVI